MTATIEDKPGQIARVSKAITQAGGNFVSFGMFAGPDANTRLVTFKVEGMKKNQVKEVLEPIVVKFWDIRLI